MGKNLLCNMRILVPGPIRDCGKSARYTHPRYPTGLFCTEHAMELGELFVGELTLIEEEIDIPTIYAMEESDFNARANKNNPVVIVSKNWENNVLMVRFYYDVQKENRHVGNTKTRE